MPLGDAAPLAPFDAQLAQGVAEWRVSRRALQFLADEGVRRKQRNLVAFFPQLPGHAAASPADAFVEKQDSFVGP